MTTAGTRSHDRLPNLIVIGAMKCGTSSLHRYLDLHPEIQMSRPKELDFFLDRRADQSWGNWERGLDWYAGHFDAGSPVRGESSVNYTNLPLSKGTAEHMHDVIPEARLIYAVRDPVDRAVSHYVHRRALGRERRPPQQALGDASSAFVSRGLYYAQLEAFLRLFPRERILVVAQEDLLHRRPDTLRRVFGFLGVDESFSSSRFTRVWEVSRGKDRKFTLAFRTSRRLGGRRWAARLPADLRWIGERVALRTRGEGSPLPALDEALRQRLMECFRPDAERLREATGEEFGAWSV